MIGSQALIPPMHSWEHASGLLARSVEKAPAEKLTTSLIVLEIQTPLESYLMEMSLVCRHECGDP